MSEIKYNSVGSTNIVLQLMLVSSVAGGINDRSNITPSVMHNVCCNSANVTIENNPFEKLGSRRYTVESVPFELMKGFANKLISGSVDLEPEIVKAVNDNFWELI